MSFECQPSADIIKSRFYGLFYHQGCFFYISWIAPKRPILECHVSLCWQGCFFFISLLSSVNNRQLECFRCSYLGGHGLWIVACIKCSHLYVHSYFGRQGSEILGLAIRYVSNRLFSILVVWTALISRSIVVRSCCRTETAVMPLGS